MFSPKDTANDWGGVGFEPSTFLELDNPVYFLSNIQPINHIGFLSIPSVAAVTALLPGKNLQMDEVVW